MWSTGLTTLVCSFWHLSQFWVSFNRYSFSCLTEYLGNTQLKFAKVSGVLCLCSCLLHTPSVLGSRAAYSSWTQQLLSNLPEFPWELYEGKTLSNQQTHFIYFLCLTAHCLLLPDIQCLGSCQTFCPSLVSPCKRVYLVATTLFWPEVAFVINSPSNDDDYSVIPRTPGKGLRTRSAWFFFIILCNFPHWTFCGPTFMEFTHMEVCGWREHRHSLSLEPHGGHPTAPSWWQPGYSFSVSGGRQLLSEISD